MLTIFVQRKQNEYQFLTLLKAHVGTVNLVTRHDQLRAGTARPAQIWVALSRHGVAWTLPRVAFVLAFATGKAVLALGAARTSLFAIVVLSGAAAIRVGARALVLARCVLARVFASVDEMRFPCGCLDSAGILALLGYPLLHRPVRFHRGGRHDVDAVVVQFDNGVENLFNACFVSRVTFCILLCVHQHKTWIRSELRFHTRWHQTSIGLCMFG